MACFRPFDCSAFDMDDNRYRGGTSAGSKWGCGVAAIVTLPIFILMVADALGDCVPDVECKKGFIPVVLAPSATIGFGLFFGVRFVVNRLRRSDRDG